MTYTAGSGTADEVGFEGKENGGFESKYRRFGRGLVGVLPSQTNLQNKHRALAWEPGPWDRGSCSRGLAQYTWPAAFDLSVVEMEVHHIGTYISTFLRGPEKNARK